MVKRRNSKSEKIDTLEVPDAKRKKEKDTRTSSRHPVAEHLSTSKTSSSKLTKVSTSNPSKSKATNDSSKSKSMNDSSNSKAANDSSKSKPTYDSSKSKTTYDSLKSKTTDDASNSKVSSSRELRSKSSTTKGSSHKASPSKSSKSSNSKPSKETKKAKPLHNLATSVVLPSSASKSSSQHPKKPANLFKSKPSKDPQESYMPTLHGIAPPKEVLRNREADILLNDEEKDADLGDDTIELYDSEEDEKKLKSGSDDEEDQIDSDEEPSDAERPNNDMDMDIDDNMTVKDITKSKKKESKKKRKSVKTGKVLESEFEDVELARLGKSSVRLGICIRNMWPREDEPDLTLFTEELGKYGNSDLLQSLKKITSSPDPNEVKRLKTFMNYGSSQVRSDLGGIIRILVAQYYNLSVSRKEDAREEIADRVRWLLDEHRYHQEVDLEERKATGAPFSTPLIGKILRAYFVDSRSYLDTFLIKHMKLTGAVPLRLIVMIATLIEHSIMEWTTGARKQIQLTRNNTEETYLFLWRIVEQSQKHAKTYMEDLPSDLYQEMTSNEPGNQGTPYYDYEAIEAAAQEKRRRRLQASGTSQVFLKNEGSGVDGASDIYESGPENGSDNGSDKGSDNGSNKGGNYNGSDIGSDNRSDNGSDKGSDKGSDNRNGSDNNSGNGSENVNENGNEGEGGNGSEKGDVISVEIKGSVEDDQ
ncbi:hypothetical protein C8R42DRAFT_727039 [Lentinula raphanica]|nr:hypothetical protein C8R42DRAFT_727039 [Lentinula raphanica]